MDWKLKDRSIKDILLTFDYELFLGKKSGSVINCMIRPTNDLLVILRKHNAKAIFFIDTTYVKRLEEVATLYPKAREDLALIIKQLCEMIRQGHYIYHHLHPHWIDATYDPPSNQWDLQNTSHFSIYSISDEIRKELFTYSSSFLSKLYKEVGFTLEPNGYRAGGLFIEPFSCFIDHFRKHNIKYEFSVVPGEKKQGDQLFYDFSTLSIRKPYRFNENLNAIEENGEFIEFPISKIKIAGIWKILNSVYYRKNKTESDHKPFGDGFSVESEINSNIINKSLKDYLRFDLAMSAEMLNPVLSKLCLKYISRNEFTHFLSHPKLLSKASLKELDNILSVSRKRYIVEFDHTKMIDDPRIENSIFTDKIHYHHL
jgi:hypothetical protein